MNILIVNMSIDPVFGGGTVERTCQLVKAFQKLPDTNARVLSTTAGLQGGAPLDAAQCILLPCLNTRWYLPAPYFFKIYKSLDWADVVILTSHWTLINAMVYFVNKITKRPYLFCPAGALHVFGRSGFIKRVYNGLVGTRILKHADRVVAIPQDEREYFCRIGVSRDRTVVIPNGITIEDFACSDTARFRDKYALQDASFLLFMGRLNEIKGPDILLQAFINIARQFVNLHLVLAGPDGGMEADLKSLIREHGLGNRVHLVGYISGEDKSAAYHAADLLVVPSRLEAMSIVALEAAACGTAVVMTDQCGFSELVNAGGAVEVSVGSENMADKLKFLLDDPGKIKEMGQRAKKFIRNNYTWEIMAKRNREVCADIQ